MKTWKGIDIVSYKFPSDVTKPHTKPDLVLDIVTPTGGPSSYYDFEPGWTTFNDFMEHKALTKWGAHSLHLKDVMKAGCRWGDKGGTTLGYDARKIAYSGLRLVGMIEGRAAMREYLLELMDDPQFKA